MPEVIFENIIVWKDTTHQFSVDDIGFQVRVWMSRSHKGPVDRMDVSLINQVILNELSPAALQKWDNEVEPCDDVLEIAIAIYNAILQNHGRIANAVEVTVRGQGSIYYPKWP